MWDYDGKIGNHYELTRRFGSSVPPAGPVILVVRKNDARGIAEFFAATRKLPPLERVDAAGKATVYNLYRLDGYRGGDTR